MKTNKTTHQKKHKGKTHQQAINNKVNDLLKKMTIEEKIGQLYEAPYYSDVVTGHKFDSSDTINYIKKGLVGSILSVHNEETIYQLQKCAVEESRLNIPLLFAFDVIHGYKTAFPINLAMSNTWEPLLIEKVSQKVAYETSHKGLHLTFSPMVDIVRDPRWGRVMESNGEDPYLSSELAKAYVKGYQQDDLSKPHALAACVKHFIGYGQVEGGREYNTVDISKRVLYNTYLPPFKAAIDQNVSMLMTSFNTVFDRPATANKYLLKNILRDELKFEGVTISDYTSTEEIIQHKVAKNEKDAAEQCFNAGLDHEMVSKTYLRYLKTLVEEGKVTTNDIDAAVKRILKLKFELGLFENPFRNLYKNSEQYMLEDDTRVLAREVAEKSVVMLKNDDILPLKKLKNVVLTGPYIDSLDTIGQWAARAEKKDVVTIAEAFQDSNIKKVSMDAKIETFKNADAIVMALGEPSLHAGEGNSKTKIYLDDTQQAFFDKIRQVNSNIILVVFAGRPLIMTYYHQHAKAILYAYQPGTETGHAIFNLITGKVSPSGKITMTFPYHEGQIPIYYNHYSTGRPFDSNKPEYRYNTRYIDCPNEPLYPFGYGLSYGDFVYSDMHMDKEILKTNETIKVSVDILNNSDALADEIVQCYIEATTFSVTRPVNELKAFKKVTFKPFEKKNVSFKLDLKDFKSYNLDMNYTAEDHIYKIKIGSNSRDLLEKTLHVIDK